MAKVIVTGDRELTGAFKNLNDRVTRSELLKIQRKAADPIVKTARQLTPRLTGQLQGSIKKFTGKNKEFPIVMIGHKAGGEASKDGYYGFWVHEGTGGRTAGGTHKASKHLHKAYESEREQAERIIFDELSKTIDEAWK